MKMFPLLYQTHLENQLSASQLLFFSLIINVLQEMKFVSLEKLADALPLPILFESRREKTKDSYPCRAVFREVKPSLNNR